MARQARILSSTGSYHIMFRGINKQEIFSSDYDYEKLKEIIFSLKDAYGIEIYAYCMMPNHMHLFLHEAEQGGISDFMKRVLSHYAGWYNFKYERTGHLFANRYKSLPVEDDSYFLTLAKYIHRNPVKAGLVENMQDYRYSSYSDYIHNNNETVNIDFLLNILDEDRKMAIKHFVSFSLAAEEQDYDFENSLQNRDLMARVKIIQITGGIKPYEIRNMSKSERIEILRKLLECDIKKTTLERLTGIPRKTIQRIEKCPILGTVPEMGQSEINA